MEHLHTGIDDLKETMAWVRKHKWDKRKSPAKEPTYKFRHPKSKITNLRTGKSHAGYICWHTDMVRRVGISALHIPTEITKSVRIDDIFIVKRSAYPYVEPFVEKLVALRILGDWKSLHMDEPTYVYFDGIQGPFRCGVFAIQIIEDNLEAIKYASKFNAD